MWIGLVPVRIGYYRSVDLAVLAVLESHNYTNTRDLRAKANSIRYYLEAMSSLQETMSSKSFWTSEEAQATVGVLSAYESTEGATLCYPIIEQEQTQSLRTGLLTNAGSSLYS